MPATQEPGAQARAVLALVPVVQQWATARVQRAGLSFRQYLALETISRGAASPGEIARAWQVTPGALTGIIDRLEARGLVRREPDPADRRRSRLVLTADGDTMRAQIGNDLTGDLTSQLTTAAPDERAALDTALALLHRVLTSLRTDELPPLSDGASAHIAANDPRLAGAEDESFWYEPPTSPAAHDAGAVGVEQRKGTEIMSTADDAVTETPTDILATIDPNDPNFLTTAYDHYAAWRDAGRVTPVRALARSMMGDERSGRPRSSQVTYYVNHYDDVVATLLDDRLSVDLHTVAIPTRSSESQPPAEEVRPLANSLLTLDPPDHTRIRKLVQPTFTPRTIDLMRGKMQRVADDLLDQAEHAAAARGETAPHRRLDLIREFAYPFPVTVISDLLGIPRDDQAQTGFMLGSMAGSGAPAAPDPEQMRERFRQFRTYMRELIERKRQQPGEDMISRMVLAVDGDETLSEDEMMATTMLMYGAGFVTTVNLIGNSVVALLTHPEQLQRLRADPGLVQNAVEEVLRFWGPAETVGRRIMTHPERATPDRLEIAGCPVAHDEMITVNLASANRDPERFADPDAFDITRPDANRHVAFGKGIHLCLGAPLARLEGQIALETLLRRYPHLRLADPSEDLAWSGIGLRGFRQVTLLV